MKKIKKIGGLLLLFILNLYTICLADAAWIDPETGERHVGGPKIPHVQQSKPVNYVLIGVLVLVVVACAVIITTKIIKKKKEKLNDNK